VESSDERHEAVVIELAGGRALMELDNGERRWMPAAPQVAVGARCVVTGRGFRVNAPASEKNS
jgi:hypothetical protein